MLKKHGWKGWLIAGYLVLVSSCTAASVIPTHEAALSPLSPLASPTRLPELNIASPRPPQRHGIESSTGYPEIIQRGDQILRVEEVPPGLVVIFFASIGKDKGGTPVPEFSTIGVAVLQAQKDAYKKLWEKVTDIESPLAYDRPLISPWVHRYFELHDLTKDGQPEIIIGGCMGFGNRCCYQATVWSLRGELLFDTGPDRFGGVQFLWDSQVIVVRHGLNVVGQAEAELHPEQWQMDWYVWNGKEFVKTATKIVPYQDFYDPILEKQ